MKINDEQFKDLLEKTKRISPNKKVTEEEFARILSGIKKKKKITDTQFIKLISKTEKPPTIIEVKKVEEKKKPKPVPTIPLYKKLVELYEKVIKDTKTPKTIIKEIKIEPEPHKNMKWQDIDGLEQQLLDINKKIDTYLQYNIYSSGGLSAVNHDDTLSGDGTGANPLKVVSGHELLLQTNGVDNGVQTLLNLVAGTNITITDDGMGNITFDATGGGGGTPAAPDTSVQFNDGGNFGGNANFTFDKTNNSLAIGDAQKGLAALEVTSDSNFSTFVQRLGPTYDSGLAGNNIQTLAGIGAWGDQTQGGLYLLATNSVGLSDNAVPALGIEARIGNPALSGAIAFELIGTKDGDSLADDDQLFVLNNGYASDRINIFGDGSAFFRSYIQTFNIDATTWQVDVDIPSNGSTLNGFYTRVGVQGGSASDYASIRGYLSHVEHSGSGVLTEAVGYYVDKIKNTGAGSITNAYGLYIDDQNQADNNWAIKTGLGQVEFGDFTFVNADLEVDGNITVFTTAASPTGIFINAEVSAVSGAGYGIDSEVTVNGNGSNGTGLYTAVGAGAGIAAGNLVGITIESTLYGAGGSSTNAIGLLIGNINGGSNNYAIKTNGGGDFLFASLGGSTTRYVTANASGVLGTTAIPPAPYFIDLFDHFANQGNGTTAETDLYSDTIAANQLINNGDKLEAEYGGVFVSSATATREIKLYFGGTVIFDTGALTLSLSSAWTMYATIIRVSASVVRYMISFTTEGAALAAYTAVGELTGLTLSGTNILKITGQAAGVGAATNDIVAKLGAVAWVGRA